MSRATFRFQASQATEAYRRQMNLETAQATSRLQTAGLRKDLQAQHPR